VGDWRCSLLAGERTANRPREQAPPRERKEGTGSNSSGFGWVADGERGWDRWNGRVDGKVSWRQACAEAGRRMAYESDPGRGAEPPKPEVPPEKLLQLVRKRTMEWRLRPGWDMSHRLRRPPAELEMENPSRREERAGGPAVNPPGSPLKVAR